MTSALTRRSLARMIGAAAGATLLAPRRSGAFAQTPGTTPSGPIRLNSNENPYGPCGASLEALGRSGASASRYPDALEQQARETIAKLHKVPPEQIVLGCGSSDVLRMADAAFLAQGKTVVAAEPTFEAVLEYARVTRAEAVKVPLTPHFRHDLKAMSAACDQRTGLVYVCNPNNPTGTIVTGAELARFFPRVPASTIILVDEAYHHFVENPEYRSALDVKGPHDNVVVARTFSKVYGMAGMRLGYVVASPEIAKAMERCASFSNTNEAVLAMGLAGLADPDAVARPRKLMNETRRWLCAELQKDGRQYIPSEANFVMIDVGTDVIPVGAKFREQGILVGRKFPSMPNWLRVSIGKREEMEAFVRVLREVVPAKAVA